MQLVKKSADPLPTYFMKPPMTTPELISALADGQSNDAQFAAVLDACVHDDSALDCWNTYHLIGDFLRQPADLPVARAVHAEITFASKVSLLLAREPLATAAQALAAKAPAVALLPVAGMLHRRGPASNDGNFRWKLLAGVASLAAVSAIAWNTSGLQGTAWVPQLAQVFPSQIVVTSPQGPVVRDARLDELLAAHRQFGTASALQESSGFLRNATFESPRNASSGAER